MAILSAIVKKELKNFIGSERGVFAVYGFLTLAWSLLPVYMWNTADSLWWLFYSVVISGTFTNSVFVAERVNGAMEILLTAGYSRNGVLFGKMAFVLLMSAAMGAVCFCVSALWLYCSGQEHLFFRFSTAWGFSLYCTGAFMNVTFGAWLSIRLQSPRVIPFIMILIIALIAAIEKLFAVPIWLLTMFIVCAGTVFALLAQKEFNGEKIIRPINL